MDVRLPNGKILQNVPDDITKEELRSKVINNGLANDNQFSDEPTSRFNTGNIRDTKNGGFKKYATPAEGAADHIRLLQSYEDKHGLNTINGILNRWAPPSENETNHYADFVSKQLGISGDTQLDLKNPVVVGRLANAMAMMEKGRDKNPLTESDFINIAGGNVQSQSGYQSNPPAGSQAAKINRQMALPTEKREGEGAELQRQLPRNADLELKQNAPEQVPEEPATPTPVTPETPVVPVAEDAMGKPVNAAAPNQTTPNPADIEALRETGNPNNRPDAFFGPLHDLGHDLSELPLTIPATAFTQVNNAIDNTVSWAAQKGKEWGWDKAANKISAAGQEEFGLPSATIDPYTGQGSLGHQELPDSLKAKTVEGNIAQQVGAFLTMGEAKLVEAAPEVMARFPWLAKGAEASINRAPANATAAAADSQTPEEAVKKFGLYTGLEFVGAPVSTKSSTTRFAERGITPDQYERTAEGALTPEGRKAFQKDINIASRIMAMPEGSSKADVLKNVPGAEEFFTKNGITLPFESRNQFNKAMSKVTQTGESTKRTMKDAIIEWALHHGFKVAAGAGLGYASGGTTGAVAGAAAAEGARYGFNKFTKNQSVREVNQLRNAFNENFSPTSLKRNTGRSFTNTGKTLVGGSDDQD